VVDQISASGSLVVTGVAITGGSTAGDGGGVRVQGPFEMQGGAAIAGNAAGHGGGAYVLGNVQMTQSSIRDNQATGTGGGLRTQGTATLGTSAVYRNRGTFGGGILAVGDISVTASTVTQNEGTDFGGGLYGAGVTVNTATVVANRSPSGANIRATGNLSSTSSIVSMGSGGADCLASGLLASSGNNFGSDGSCGFLFTGDVEVAHPMLAPLVDRSSTASRAPVSPSPVVDHDPVPCTGNTFDQHVNGRGAPCSSGSVELQPPPCTATFPDVPTGHVFFPQVCWLSQMGITGGYPDGGFHPADPVTRQAMAAFLFRFAEAPAFTPPSTPTFADVGLNNPFRREVEWLADEEIALGYADGLFHPTDPVTRQAMATFLYRVGGAPLFVPTGATFPDVPPTHVFYIPIEWLVANGIADGYEDGLFHPGSSVTRQAMAAFLLRMAENDRIDGL
jgi:hypothetical protein